MKSEAFYDGSMLVYQFWVHIGVYNESVAIAYIWLPACAVHKIGISAEINVSLYKHFRRTLNALVVRIVMQKNEK